MLVTPNRHHRHQYYHQCWHTLSLHDKFVVEEDASHINIKTRIFWQRVSGVLV